ncbi:hypothetical protein EDB89DRAFT_1903641 [Lactarius sanguifluus]|nr:hypothetical protein EDB89DRAFT_1903641 [Lactarius sanguifluus]
MATNSILGQSIIDASLIQKEDSKPGPMLRVKSRLHQREKVSRMSSGVILFGLVVSGKVFGIHIRNRYMTLLAKADAAVMSDIGKSVEYQVRVAELRAAGYITG